MRAVVSSSSDVVAPVMMIVSPSAMIMKSWKRSAKCAVSTCHVVWSSAGPPRDPVEDERRRVVDRQREHPQRRTYRIVREAARDPEDARRDEPDEDPSRPLALDRAAVGRDERQERVAPDLEDDIRRREQEAALAERIRDRNRHHEAGEHHADQQEPDDGRVGVELVRDPGRVVPRPPDDEQHERAATGARPCQVVEQQVGDLRDREHEDQVEEQLQRRRALLLPRVTIALEAGHLGRAYSAAAPLHATFAA